MGLITGFSTREVGKPSAWKSLQRIILLRLRKKHQVCKHPMENCSKEEIEGTNLGLKMLVRGYNVTRVDRRNT